MCVPLAKSDSGGPVAPRIPSQNGLGVRSACQPLRHGPLTLRVRYVQPYSSGTIPPTTSFYIAHYNGSQIQRTTASKIIILSSLQAVGLTI